MSIIESALALVAVIAAKPHGKIKGKSADLVVIDTTIAPVDQLDRVTQERDAARAALKAVMDERDQAQVEAATLRIEAQELRAMVQVARNEIALRQEFANFADRARGASALERARVEAHRLVERYGSAEYNFFCNCVPSRTQMFEHVANLERHIARDSGRRR